eukprot:scaffold6730_cov108-Isochrysis_galbana.AAC.1
MDHGSGTHPGRTQTTQAAREITVGTLKRGPPLRRVRGDRGQPTGAQGRASPPSPSLKIEATHTAPPHA